MIEDFTLLQGIQHDLLEAMIELPAREGRQVMCGDEDRHGGHGRLLHADARRERHDSHSHRRSRSCLQPRRPVWQCG